MVTVGNAEAGESFSYAYTRPESKTSCSNPRSFYLI